MKIYYNYRALNKMNFKQIKEFKNYFIDKEGNIFNYQKQQLIRPTKTKTGILRVNLKNGKKQKNFIVSHLVIKYFSQLHNNKYYVVSYKDGNKSNCNINNLIINKSSYVFTKSKKREYPKGTKRSRKIPINKMIEAYKHFINDDVKITEKIIKTPIILKIIEKSILEIQLKTGLQPLTINIIIFDCYLNNETKEQIKQKFNLTHRELNEHINKGREELINNIIKQYSNKFNILLSKQPKKRELSLKQALKLWNKFYKEIQNKPC